jgi:hypothetical protein
MSTGSKKCREKVPNPELQIPKTDESKIGNLEPGIWSFF